MVRLSIPAVLAFASLVIATPQRVTPDPSGAKNVGNGAGKQFITGACRSTADCAQPACCAGIAGDSSIGICSGLAVGNVAGKTGCGFGDNGAKPAPAAPPARPPAPPVVAPAPAPAPAPARPPAAPPAAPPARPPAPPVVAPAPAPAPARPPAAPPAAPPARPPAPPIVAPARPPAPPAAAPVAAPAPVKCKVDSAKAGSQNLGKGNKSQFITGQCISKADCASNCCVAQATGVGECRAELVSIQARLSCDFTCTL